MRQVSLFRPVTIDRAIEDFDRYFQSFFGNSLHSPAERNTPAVDIKETDDAYTLEMELPGHDEKSIEVNLDGRKLTVSSKRESEKEEKKENYLLREREVTSFSRTFSLPENANGEQISAQFKNGILFLDVKKQAEAVKKRLIEIKTN